MKKTGLTILGLGLALFLFGQDYTSFFTGSTNDVQPTPFGGTCLMGGSTENDNAMRWFLQRAAGGDVLVIRASGSDGYNSYMYSELGVNVNSVETIRFNNQNAANDPYVLERLAKAEAIWIAGGDQWDYVSYWRNSPVANLINASISQRNIVIGGTSAGMAILGGVYFSAQNGTVTSDEALANPYNNDMTIQNEPFLTVPFLENIITDTHYDQRNRRGRHLTFLAKALTDYGQVYHGIACNESTAVCITTEGIARIFGTYPDFDDTAYFLVPNCEINNNQPELCVPNQPLTWNLNGTAIKAYVVKGTPTGLYQFDLTDWKTGDGGHWENWSANNGVFQNLDSEASNCFPSANVEVNGGYDFNLFPNPINDNRFNLDLPENDFCSVKLYGISGQFLKQWTHLYGRTELFWDFGAKGVYMIEVESFEHGSGAYQLVVR